MEEKKLIKVPASEDSALAIDFANFILFDYSMGIADEKDGGDLCWTFEGKHTTLKYTTEELFKEFLEVRWNVNF